MCQHDPAFINDSICYICHRDRVAASAVDVLEASAQRREAREFAPHPDLAPELAALLNQHNADVDQRKAAGDKRRGGWTYLDRLESTQENKR